MRKRGDSSSSFVFSTLRNVEPDYPALPSSPPETPEERVVVIPVGGPHPFNTLVVVRCTVVITPNPEEEERRRRRPAPGDAFIRRFSHAVPTGFRHPGFELHSKPLFRHSTTGSISLVKLDAKAQFTVALDQIDDAYFDDKGVWTVKVNFAAGVAASPPATTGATIGVHLTSWILCSIPPPAQGRARRGKASMTTPPPTG